MTFPKVDDVEVAPANHRHALRGKTADEWASINSILDDKELGYETDTGVLKIGDGATAWNDLAVFVKSLLGLDRRYLATVIADIAYTEEQGTADASAYLQDLSDTLEAAGGGILTLPPGTWRHTFTELGDGVFLVGCGPATVVKLKDGVALRTPTNGSPSGSYGLTTKSGVDHAGVFNLSYDGNYTGTADYADNMDTIFLDGVATPGQYKIAGIAISRLNRGDTWVAPNHFWIDNVYSHDTVRSCFIFQMEDGRPGDPGYVHAGKLVAKNAAFDHWLYCSESTTISIEQFHGMGYARDGGMILSGGKLGSVYISELTANPNYNTTNDFQFETQFLIHDRPETTRGATIDGLTIEGDFAALTTDDTIRALIYSQSPAGPTYSNIQIFYTGTDPDLPLMICNSTGSLGSPGHQKGPTLRSVKGKQMPGGTVILAHDPAAYGSTLFGGVVEDVFLSIAADAVPTAGALFTFDGTGATNFVARDITVETDDFGNGGPSAVYANAQTDGPFTAVFENINMPRAASANAPWIDATTTAVGVRLERINTNAGGITQALKFTVNRIINCTFGSTTIRDSDTPVAYKTADQSRTGSTTLTNDMHLLLDVWPGAVYAFELDLIVDAPTSGGLKFGLAAPAGATMDFTGSGPSLSAVSGNESTTRWRGFVASTSDTVSVGGLGAGNLFPAFLRGMLYVGATGGTLQAQFAQATSNATPSYAKHGSSLRLRRVS